MEKKDDTRRKIIAGGTILLVGGLVALGFGMYVNLSMATVTSSFGGQVAMWTGQLRQQEVRETLERAKLYMGLGAGSAAVGLVALLAGIFVKKKRPSVEVAPGTPAA